MHRLAALLAAVTLLAATPVAAVAQETPLFPGAGGQAQTPSLPDGPPPPAPVEHRQDGDGLTLGVGLAVGAAVVLLIGGIWFAITRDARQAVPSRRRSHTSRADPERDLRAGPGSRGQHPARPPAKRRKLSKREQKRRKRGRAR